jgi:hypothetical protein
MPKTVEDFMGIPVVVDERLPPGKILIGAPHLSRLYDPEAGTITHLDGTVEPMLDPPRFEHEHKTVWLFGKPYYWAVKRTDGGYVLKKGYSLEDIDKRRLAAGEPGTYRISGDAHRTDVQRLEGQ